MSIYFKNLNASLSICLIQSISLNNNTSCNHQKWIFDCKKLFSRFIIFIRLSFPSLAICSSFIFLFGIQMEGNSKIDLSSSLSDWKIKQESLKNQRNFKQLENRLLILEMERQSKIKSIQKKLDRHKKMMEVRMDRFRLKQEIQKNDRTINEQQGSNSRLFRDTRVNRAMNIRSKTSQFKEVNHRLVQQVRHQRQANQAFIKSYAQNELKAKAMKRNQVRLIQTASKQNVNKFWRSRLQQLRSMREAEMMGRLEQQQKKRQWLFSLQKSQEQLLGEIRKAEEMEAQLDSMMEEQKSVVYSAIGNQQQMLA